MGKFFETTINVKARFKEGRPNARMEMVISLARIRYWQMWQHVWNIIKIVEGRQRKILYMKMMKCVVYWMCKNHANRKRSSDCHEHFKLTTRLRVSKDSQFCHRYFKLTTKILGSGHHQTTTKVQLTKRTWVSQDFRICHKNFKLKTRTRIPKDYQICHNDFKLTTRMWVS